MKFDIVNPSDPYTMAAPDLEVAAVAVCLLGDGKYPLTGLGDAAGQDVPPFLFVGPNAWFNEKFGADYVDTANRVIVERSEELATALDSVTLESARRTSLNDIGMRAKLYAAQIRSHAAEKAGNTEKS